MYQTIKSISYLKSIGGRTLCHIQVEEERKPRELLLDTTRSSFCKLSKDFFLCILCLAKNNFSENWHVGLVIELQQCKSGILQYFKIKRLINLVKVCKNHKNQNPSCFCSFFMVFQNCQSPYNLTNPCLSLFSCQFVVKESADYSVNAVDPDVLVDWDLIEQVVNTNCIVFYPYWP